MKDFKLPEKDYEFIKVHRDYPPMRFAVQSRGGLCKHDVFQSLDDAMDYIFECMREDVLFINYVEIQDLRTNLVFTFDNLKYFYRHLLNLEV